MRTFIKVTFVTVLILTVIPWPAQAQVARTGSLEGRVTDTNGLPLPGVTVTINSEALIRADLAAQTGQNGRYRFLSLPPGLYQVRFELAGFQTVVRENIRVSLSAATNLNVTLASGVTEEVTVVAERPTVDTKEVSLTTNLPADFLRDTPVTRQALDFIDMIPGFHSETAHGSGERENTLFLDGVETSSPFGGSLYSNFSVDIIEEIAVQMGGLKAEHESSRGAVVNVITKSGGNKFSGGVGLHISHKNLQSDNSKGTPFEGQEVGIDHEYSGSGTLGGAIVRDKLWFFGAGEYIDRSDFEEGFPWDKPSEIALGNNERFLFGKLTWQVAPRDTLTLSFNYRRNYEDFNNASDTRNEEATRDDKDNRYTSSLNYQKTIGNNFLWNSQVAFYSTKSIQLSRGRSARYTDNNTDLSTRGSGRDRWDNHNRFNVLTDMTYLVDDWAGSHEFKAGISAFWIRTNRTDEYLKTGEHSWPETPGAPYYVYTRGEDPYYVRFRITFTRHVDLNYIGAYLQDTWRPTSRLVLNLGARFDHLYGFLPPQGGDREKLDLPGFFFDPELTETMEVIKWNNISPRLGAVYDVTGDGKTVIKASFNRLYKRGMAILIDGLNPNDVIEYRYRLNPDWSLDTDRGWYSLRAGVGNRVDPNLKSPRMDELTFGVERELARDLSLGLRYIRKWDRLVMDDVCENQLDFERFMSTGELVWTNYEPVQGTDPVTGEPLTFWTQIDSNVVPANVYANPPGLNRDYDALEVTLNKRMSNNWMARATYVFANSRGLIGLTGDDTELIHPLYNDPNGHTNADGRLETERRHQIRINATYHGPYGIMASTFIKWWSGFRYTRLVNSDDVGIDLEQGDWDVLAEPKGSRGLPNQFLVDLRLEKAFWKVRLSVDFFNLFNANTFTNIWAISSRPGIEFESARDILYPRQLRFNVIFDF